MLILALAFCGRPLFAQTCDYYASPTGTGNGLTESTPFQIADFWPVATAGDTLCLLDGTYLGPESMINPPSGLAGSAGSPITVRAVNDGKVLIDGQAANQPVMFTISNDHFTLQGFNAANAGTGGGATVSIRGFGNVVRRVIAWNGNPDCNCHNWQAYSASNTLFEDIAGFGSGRYQFLNFQSTATTVRRGWFRWEKSNDGSPKATMNLNYASTDSIFENCLATWATQPGHSPTNLYGVFMIDGDGTTEYNDRILGSFGYVPKGVTFSAGYVFIAGNSDDITLKDVYGYLPSGMSGKTVFGLDGVAGAYGDDLALTNATAVRDGGRGIVIGLNDWVQVNTEQGQTVGDVSNAFTGTAGATLCYRYVDGTLTSTPLWPWPMNRRILDAMNAAGVAPVDVTATVEGLLKRIPSACLRQRD